jgi:hypothetical protein
METHAGTIELRQRPGGGAEFILHFVPVAQAYDPSAEPARAG